MSDNPNSNAAGATPATGATPGAADPTANPGASGATPDAGATPSQDSQSNFDNWLAEQQEPVKQMISARFATLEGTLQTERHERKELARQIKELSKNLDANSDAAKQLGELSNSLEAAQKRADFYEQATAAGCTMLKPAYLLAQADGLTVEQIKAQYPAFFATPTAPPTHAGNGTRQPPPPANDMNQLIRRAAGRR